MHLFFLRRKREIVLQGRKGKEGGKKSIAVNKTSGEEALLGMTIPPKRVCMGKLAAMIVSSQNKLPRTAKQQKKRKDETHKYTKA